MGLNSQMPETGFKHDRQTVYLVPVKASLFLLNVGFNNFSVPARWSVILSHFLSAVKKAQLVS